jgi:ribosome-binding protein aMBF1 (putative translation factor)
MAGPTEEMVRKARCDVCGLEIEKIEGMEVQVCDECERMYHLGETEFGLNGSKLRIIME